MFTLLRGLAARHTHKMCKELVCRQPMRTFLDSSYMCQDEWATSCSMAELDNIDEETFYMTLNKSFNTGKPVPPIDMDMFATMASLRGGDQLLDDLQDVTHRFRRTLATVATLPSTSHAVVRAFLPAPAGRLVKLMDMLHDRMNYGVFLDYFTANMIMDRWLKLGNKREAARAASHLMLQEAWQHPISRPLALYCCWAYLQTGDTEPWTPSEPEDNGETEYVRVAYLRNEWHDNHFDLTSTNHVLGKTLAWLAGDMTCTAGVSCRLLGSALYGKWKDVRQLCDYLTTTARNSSSTTAVGARVTKDAMERTMQTLAAAAASEDSVARDQVESATAAALLVPLSDEHAPPLLELLSRLVSEAVLRQAEDDRGHMTAMFHEWRHARQVALQSQRESEDRQRRISALDEKRSYLRRREQLLYFFNNERAIVNDVDRTWNKPPKPKPLIVYRILRRRKTDEEDYVPPSVK